MKRWLARLIRLGAGISVLGAVWACNAPFIPVPPPAQAGFTATMVPDGNGGQKTVWTAMGTAGEQAALARVFVINEATDNGVVTRADGAGTYQSPAFAGTIGDRIDIYFEDHNGAPSPTACLILQEGPQAPQCPSQ